MQYTLRRAMYRSSSGTFARVGRGGVANRKEWIRNGLSLWQVVPVYYVLFTLCTVLAGAVGFKEFQPENIGL